MLGLFEGQRTQLLVDCGKEGWKLVGYIGGRTIKVVVCVVVYAVLSKII